MRTYLCVVIMFGARFAVFDRTERMLFSTCQATRNFFVLEVSTGTVTLLFQLVILLEMVLDGLKFPLDEPCTNKYAHVVVVREHVWRTLCSVSSTGARVAQPFLSNS